MRRFTKIGIPVLAMAMFAGMSAPQARADRIRVELNGEPISFQGAQPRQVDGRVLVPLRGVLEKMGATVDLPWGFTWSTNVIFHSGLAYPAYITTDVNGDGTSNQGFGTNDRPTVQLGSGKPFLLPFYPGRQPYFFDWDMRIAKDFHFRERYGLRLSADLFNITNASNLYSNPDKSAFIDYPANGGSCVPYPNSVTLNCTPLTSLPKVGQVSTINNSTYRALNELAPGATAFAAQLGVRFQF